MKILLISLFFFGIILSIIGYYRNRSHCPKQKVKYMFIPQTLEEKQAFSESASVTFKDMFTNKSPRDK